MKFKINIIESERGCDQRIDSSEIFETWKEAVEFRDKFNSETNLEFVPDWYMIAEGPYPYDR